MGGHVNEALRISRQFSQRAVMEAIIQGGPVSRASIAKQTGLSKQTISAIVRQLEAAGWVQQTGRTSGRVGRTAVTYEIVRSAAYLVVVDLGGTKVHVALTDLAGAIFAEEIAATDGRGGQSVVRQIAELTRRVAAREGIESAAIRLAVIGVPGVLDQASGRVLLAPNIAGLDAMDVVASLEAALNTPVIVENDVNLAVVGESWLGVGQGFDDLAFIAVGTGIGGGLMLDGKLIHGAANAAGELGFMAFGADPFAPEALRVGAFEQVVASVGIRKRYQALAGIQATVPEIFDRAASKELAALTVLDETARYLARGIATLGAVANPRKIILGGSIGARPELVARVRALLPLCSPAPVEVEASGLGPHATIVGAAAVGLGQLHNTLFGAEAPVGTLSLPRAGDIALREALR